jgi:hypothetical protein
MQTLLACESVPPSKLAGKRRMRSRLGAEPQLGVLVIAVSIAALVALGFLLWPIYASASPKNWLDGLISGGAVLSGALLGQLIRRLCITLRSSRTPAAHE